MLNQQAPLRTDYDEDGWLKVHSVFDTIQGEGPFAGEAATFVRLYGCNLQCPWCDTEYTSRYEHVNPLTLAQEMPNRFQPPNRLLVVITGGEPFRQNITPFVKLLLNLDIRVQIETNGVLYPGDDFPWASEGLTVVCSPKTAKIHPKTAELVDAYKYVLSYDDVNDIDGLPNTALGHALGMNATCVARPPKSFQGPIYLNPMDAQDQRANVRNYGAVVTTIMDHPGRYIMGVQIHKIVGLP